MQRILRKIFKQIFPTIFILLKLVQRNQINKGLQIILAENFKRALRNNEILPAFEDVEFSNFSQNGEDGILLYIFSIIGASNKKCLEICAGDGLECNTSNLIINHGWSGWLFDGDIQNVKIGRKFFSERSETKNLKPVFVHSWITKENVNNLLSSNGLEGEIDLLSLDIDGVDYWILDAIECVQPRVIVLEFQCIWGVDKIVTVPYDSEFKAGFIDHYGIYCGASLPAFVKLLKQKGYRLVGFEQKGYNAFFIRNGIGDEVFPEIKPEKFLEKPFVQFVRKQFLKKIQNREWVEI